MVRPVAAILVLASVCACSAFSHRMTWSRPGVDENQAQADLDTCQQAARAQTKVDRQIDQDISATSGGDLSGEPVFDGNMSSYQSRSRYNDIIDSCMLSLGYTRVQ